MRNTIVRVPSCSGRGDRSKQQRAEPEIPEFNLLMISNELERLTAIWRGTSSRNDGCVRRHITENDLLDIITGQHVKTYGGFVKIDREKLSQRMDDVTLAIQFTAHRCIHGGAFC